MPLAHIKIATEQVASFCRKHHIRRLALFGSVLREDFNVSSDVDVLVEFDPDHTPGFIELHNLERKLSPLLGDRKLDLVTEKFLNPRIRDQILREARVQYAEGR